MNTQYTAGPWRRSSMLNRDEYATVILGPNGQVIAHAQVDVNTDPEEAEDNAKLIAAAPELFNSLQTLVNYAGMKSFDKDVLNILVEQAKEIIKAIENN